MPTTSAFAETASLIGDPARANILTALMDGRALTAAELARVAGIAPQTASGHLARLASAGLLAVERQGRHRYHRLASAEVALMLEGIMSVTAQLGAAGYGAKVRPVVVGPRDEALRRVRTCYDHLAGQLAVAIADRMVERGQLDFSPDGGSLSGTGVAFLSDLGVDLSVQPQPGRRNSGARVFCRPCLDWSERRPHIGGVVGVALCRSCFSQGWLRRIDGTRAVTVTQAGQIALSRAFELTLC